MARIPNLFLDGVDELPLGRLVEVVNQSVVLLLQPLLDVDQIFRNVSFVDQTLALRRVQLLRGRQEFFVERVFVNLEQNVRK